MPPDRLPTPATSFIGRAEELAEIAMLLADPNCRLVTVLGPGGIGKTRLALQVATDQMAGFAQGVFFVPLAPVGSPDLLAATIAEALQISFYGSEAPSLQLARYLREKEVLLVLDNFEHLLAGIDLLTELLDAARAVKLLVTSRERLNVQEEWVFALKGLSFPKTPGDAPLESYSAAQLFVQRAHQIQNSFSLNDNLEAVRTICQRVDGMPLGLELAATWLRAMTCDQVAAQMERSLDLLTTPLRNVEERHRSLRAVFEQSWRLLSDDERDVLMKLAVFRGGFDREAAEQVARASLSRLAGLVDKSLIRLNPSGRYDLHELLRQFAMDKLVEAGETAVVNRHHLEYYLWLAERVEAYVYGPEQEAWFDRLEVEHDNLRAALAWALRDEDAEMGWRLAVSLGWFWELRTHQLDNYDWIAKLLTLESDDIANSLRSRAYQVAAALAGSIHPELVQMYAERGLALAREAGDPQQIAWALNTLGALYELAPDRALPYLQEGLALSRVNGDDFCLSHALRRLSWATMAQGDFDQALPLAEEALVLARAAQDKNATAWALYLLGRGIVLHGRDFERGQALLEEGLALSSAIHDQGHLFYTLFVLGHIVLSRDAADHAERYFQQAVTLINEIAADISNLKAIIVTDSGWFASLRGDWEQAATLLGAGKVYFGDNASYYEQVMAEVRAQLDPDVFAAAWAQGRAMPLEAAVELALQPQPSNPASASRPNQPLIDPLSKREMEVLRWIAEGLTNAQIAHKLFISVPTVKVHAGNIYSKLGVSNRTQAVTQAQKLNLL